MDCPEEGFKNGECQIKIKKYKDRILFINWFNGTRLRYPSFNNDNSGLLLIEYTPNIDFIRDIIILKLLIKDNYIFIIVKEEATSMK